MKHLKLYYALPDRATLDHGFDDRTLASMVNTLDSGRPRLPDDGNDQDDPYRTLPLSRWDDVPIAKAAKVRWRDR